jgi:hypothetical protein
LNHESLEFPCLSIGENGVHTMPWKTVVTTALALRKKAHIGRRIVDCTGAEYTVIAATKIRGFGPFGGWNLFLNQDIVVRLELEPTGKTYTADELRQVVLEDFRSWGGWESRDDFDELKQAVSTAASCAGILRALTRHAPPEPTG